MEVTLKAVNVPTVGTDGLPAYQEHSDGLCIRLSVKPCQSTELPPFDFTRLRLQGAIRTQIGNKRSVEKFLNLTEECFRSQFSPSHSSNETGRGTYRANIVFDTAEKPLTATTTLPNRPIPSTSIEASGLVTKHTALQDQHQIQGFCETHCWATADFYHDGVLVHSARAAIVPKCRPTLLSFRSDKTNQPHATSLKCLPPKPALSAFRKTVREGPSAMVHLHDDSLIVVPSRTQDNVRCSTVSIPLQVSLLQLSSDDIACIEQEGGLPCEIETRWISQKAVRVGSNCANRPDQTTLTKRTASTQISNITFPPAYIPRSTQAAAVLSTTGILQLILPESASLPTLTSELLQVEYALELRIRFRLRGGTYLKGKMKTPCILEG